MATVSETDVIRKADALIKLAYLAQRLVDSHNYFLCAADLYQEAGEEASAKWATTKADQCMRVMSL